jgi:hypothetical protein
MNNPLETREGCGKAGAMGAPALPAFAFAMGDGDEEW